MDAEGIITVLEISQYTFAEAGSSACTPISCSAVAALLERLDTGRSVNDVPFLTDVIISGVSGYGSLSHGAQNINHLSVEEFYSASIDLKTNIRQIGESFQGLLTKRNAFMEMINTAREIISNSSSSRNKHIGLVITKPPETVCVTIPPLDSAVGEATYSFFDSHSRPEHGITGSYLVTSRNIDSILLRLAAIFPECPDALDSGDQDSYMQMMYSTFECTVFQRV